jgi:hypothetical protein
LSFTARFAQDAEDAELEVFSFAVEGTAKENQSTLILLQLNFFTSDCPFSHKDEFFLLSALSAESKKKLFFANFATLR